MNSRAPKIKQPSADLCWATAQTWHVLCGLQFPTLERAQPLWKSPTIPTQAAAAAAAGPSVSTLSCSGWPRRALPCFVFAAGPTTDALLAALLSTAEASSFAQCLAAFIRTEKVGRGQLARATEIAHDSPRSGGKVCRRDRCLPRALSLTEVAFGTHRHRGFPRSFPSGRADSAGDRQLQGRPATGCPGTGDGDI